MNENVFGNSGKFAATSGTRSAEWFFLRAKLAVAVAVIKTTPSGMSVREHCEALALRLKNQDESWKGKALELEKEVLRLQQELLLTKMTTASKSSREAAESDDTVQNFSQDLFGPGNEACNNDLQPNCDEDSQTPIHPEAEVQEPDPAPSTDFTQLQPCYGHASDPHGKMVFPHLEFLLALCGLRRVGGRAVSLEAVCFSPEGELILVDTVCQLFDSIVMACKAPPAVGPGDLILQACQVAAQVMDLFCARKRPSVKFVIHMEESLRELTAVLLNCPQPSGLQVAETLRACLTAVGGSRMSTCFLIRHILSLINTLADLFVQLCQGEVSAGLSRFPVDQYENSCHLFMILEELLQKSEVRGREVIGAEKDIFLKHLEQNLCLLSEEFPLFAIYMWKIGSLLNS
ncbi:meiosis-specific protein MEI4 [Thalassophryne amazonica]|uniref:meiosis-specific protein MEI4 n=1 Tax=Thalassophryne amazonica TaxID=390379 RepID=UPI0014720059|nr:meiosis-specific protein MEI4 [Thalassophryne amazonica]